MYDNTDVILQKNGSFNTGKAYYYKTLSNITFQCKNIIFTN